MKEVSLDGVQTAAKGWGCGERAGLQKRGMVAGEDWTVGSGWVEGWDNRLRQLGERQFIPCGGEGQSDWAKPEPILRKRWTGVRGITGWACVAGRDLRGAS